MSYAYELTDRATSGLKNLDLWLQEETLDEIDRAAADPLSLKVRLHGNAVHDFVRTREGRQYYVFITIVRDTPQKRLLIKEIGFFNCAIS